MSTPNVVLPILGPSQFKALVHGEILQGAFGGHPIISVFDAENRKGSAVKLNQNHLEVDLSRCLEAVKKEFGINLSRLQIKFIVASEDEARVKELCNKYNLNPQAVAGVEVDAKLDVFFFTSTGRLRIAPSAQAFRETSQRVNAEKESHKSKVLIVDDSKTMRAILRKIFEACPDLEVVAEAELPSQVEDLIAKFTPDVMTLDINMPEMSGVQLLAKILSYRFIPTVMITSVTIDDGEEVLKALELGAVDYIQKPELSEIPHLGPMIQEKVLNAARVKRSKFGDKILREKEQKVPAVSVHQAFSTHQLIAIGASTGGTEAIKRIFMNFPKEIPPIVVVQHIPPYFSKAFANRLNEVCKFEVREAVNGDELKPGLALIAPGGLHLEVLRERGKMVVRLFDGEFVNRFKPSVDVMFASVAKNIGSQATGVLLTGMGSDGAKGLLEMKKTGAFTIAQNEESCVVFGMPRAAIELGAASVVESLDHIPNALMTLKAA